MLDADSTEDQNLPIVGRFETELKNLHGFTAPNIRRPWIANVGNIRSTGLVEAPTSVLVTALTSHPFPASNL